MHKKKIGALLVAGLLTAGAVGGTLSWLTSQDSKTYTYNMAKHGTGSNDINEGIRVNDYILNETDGVYNKPVFPGDTITKEVWFENTAKYDQFVRAKITKIWKDSKGSEVTHYKITTSNGKESVVFTKNPSGTGWKSLNYDNIILNMPDMGDSVGKSWFKATDGYYYYNVALEPLTNLSGNTRFLIDKLTLSEDTDNVYKNLTMDVKVEAEAIQSTNGAAQSSGWSVDVPVASVKGYKSSK